MHVVYLCSTAQGITTTTTTKTIYKSAISRIKTRIRALVFVGVFVRSSIDRPTFHWQVTKATVDASLQRIASKTDEAQATASWALSAVNEY